MPSTTATMYHVLSIEIVFRFSNQVVRIKILRSKIYFFLQVRLAKGHGKITSLNTVSVLDDSGSVSENINAKNILIATGSEVTPFAGIEVCNFFIRFPN